MQKKVLEARKDPGKYPDLVVRVTGFSASFASLSPELRQFVVDRMLREGASPQGLRRIFPYFS
jgi:pyruvate-formate lyase